MTRKSRTACIWTAIALAILFAFAGPSAAQEYSVTGMIVSVNTASRTFTASIQAIPGYMQAMTMPFEVRQAAELDGLSPGVVVTFTLVVDPTTSHAERIRIIHYQNTEQDPFSASRLKLLSDLASAKRTPSGSALRVGQQVPDFTLIDQKRRKVSLSQLRGKVVVANFIYTDMCSAELLPAPGEQPRGASDALREGTWPRPCSPDCQLRPGPRHARRPGEVRQPVGCQPGYLAVPHGSGGRCRTGVPAVRRARLHE
jgi:Cu/Ag efflux protein CusF